MKSKKKTVKIIFTLIGVLPIVILLSCEGTTRPFEEIIFPEENVSYSEHVQPLFFQRCATSGCHTDGSMMGGLSLTSYFNATQNPLIIIPEDAENSLLIIRIEGRAGLPRMPLNREPLTSNQIRGLRTWIEEGAENN